MYIISSLKARIKPDKIQESCFDHILTRVALIKERVFKELVLNL